MKKPAMILFFVGIAAFTSAQTTSGTFAVGADFPNFFNGLSRSGMKLNAGIFVADNFLFGVKSGIRTRSLLNLANRNIDGYGVDVSAFARYYIPDASSDLRLFVHGEGGIDYAWADDLKERFEFVGVGAGAAYFVIPELAIEASSTLFVNNQDSELNFSWTSWTLGIKYFIGE